MVKVVVENAECRQVLPFGLYMLRKQTEMRRELGIPVVQRFYAQGGFSLDVRASEFGDRIAITGGGELRGISYFVGAEDLPVSGQQFNVLRFAGAWKNKKPAGLEGFHAGNINWTDGKRTLSWWGVSRYFSTIATVDATLRETIDTGGMMFTAGMGSQVVKGQMYCLKEWDASAPADGFSASINLVTSVSSQMGGPYVDELTGMTVSGEDIYGGYGAFSEIDLGSIDNILYCEGKAYLLPTDMGNRINGAAFAKIGAVTKLVIVCRKDYDTTGHNRSTRNTRESVWVATLGGASILNPVKIATFTYASTPFFNLSPWLFSADGKSAVCHRMADGVSDPKLCRIELDDALETVEFFDDGYYFTSTNTYGYPNVHIEAVEVIRDYKGNTLTVGELRSESTFLEEDYQHPDPSNAVTGDIYNSHELTYAGGAFDIVLDGVTTKTVSQAASAMQRVDSFYFREYGYGGEGGANGYNSIMQSTLSASGVTTRHIFLNDIDLRDGYVNIETLELMHGEDSYTRFTTNQTFPLPVLPPAPPTAGFGGAITCTAMHEAFTSMHVLFSETTNTTIAAVADSEVALPFRSGRYGLQFTAYSRVSPLSLQSGSVCFESIAFSGIPGTSPGGVFVNHSYVNCDVGRGRLPHFARNWRQMDVQMASTSTFEPGGKRLVVGPKLANARAQIIRYGTDQPNWTQAGAERITVLEDGELDATKIRTFPLKV